MAVSPVRRHLPPAFVRPWFRRLLITRMAGQLGDGLFQASLAAAVLFSPEQQPNAGAIAAALAVILLPYSVIGPLAGVVLDRWWRQRVLQWTNVVRGVLVLGVGALIAAEVTGPFFYASALVVISTNRFILAGLSASLPHAVPREELVTANAVSTTLGAIANAVGLGIGVGVAGVIGANDVAYAWIAAVALVPYLAAALAARGFPLRGLGPDDVERAHRETALDVVRGFAAGARHVAELPAARRALLMIGAHRFCFGVGFVCILLLFRNYLTDDGPFRAGLAGLGQVVVAVAVGGFLAALVTPRATRAMGFIRWSVALLLGSALLQVALGLPYRASTYVIGAFALGFAAQGIKICVDTIVQRTVGDDFRGRVFSLYDTLFNVMSVVSAAVTAWFVPTNGYAPLLVVLLGAGYLLIGIVYFAAGARAHTLDSGRTHVAAPTGTAPSAPPATNVT